MQLIADMIDEITDEYEGAEAYAKKAVQFQKIYAPIDAPIEKNFTGLHGTSQHFLKIELQHQIKQNKKISTGYRLKLANIRYFGGVGGI